MSNIKVKKPLPLKQQFMLALLPALGAGIVAMHFWPSPKAQAEAEARAMLAAEAAQYSCLKAAGLHPDARSRVVTREEAAALAKCRAR
jgi:hypothetical protein